MKKNLTQIFLEAAREVDSQASSDSCFAVARASGHSRGIETSRETYPEAAFYCEATGLFAGGDYNLWSLPARERKAVRVLLLCLMAAAWRDLPKEGYGL